MQKEALGQLPNSNWPVRAVAFDVGTTDQPAPAVAERASGPPPAARWPWPETAATAGPADAARASATAQASPARAMRDRAPISPTRDLGQTMTGFLLPADSILGVSMRSSLSRRTTSCRTLDAADLPRHGAGHSLRLVPARNFRRARLRLARMRPGRPSATIGGVRPTVLIVDDHA